MERLLMKELASTSVAPAGGSSGGCISQGAGYLTDNYGHVFVKQNKKSGAATMFMGELEGLKALEGTGCIRVPKPIKVFPMPDGGAAIVVEHVHINSLSTCEAEAGTNLARLHLHNRALREKEESSDDGTPLRYVAEFGFSTTTCCGYIPQDNTWTDDWVTFFTQRRLELQVNLAVKEYHDQELLHQWTAMKPKISSFFTGIVVEPSLLHGDLWAGNIGQTKKGEPIVFDPASFYGHDEYDLGISSMFGGFGKSFFDAYHKLIPRTEGFDVRQELYKLLSEFLYENTEKLRALRDIPAVESRTSSYILSSGVEPAKEHKHRDPVTLLNGVQLGKTGYGSSSKESRHTLSENQNTTVRPEDRRPKHNRAIK